MRVGTFLRSWTPGGGVQRHTLEIYRRLPGIEWVCFGHEFEVEVPNSFELWNPPGPSGMQYVSRFLASPLVADRLRENHDLDLLHAQDANVLGYDVVTVHGCFPAYAREYLSERYRKFHPTYYREFIVQKLSLERPDGPIIAVSRSLRDQLLEFYDLDPERVKVVYNGVELDRFRPDRDAREIREKHGFSEEENVLLFVGHEYERKGFGDLLEALAGLPEHMKLLSVGGGDREPWKQRARELGLADRVTFTGYVPDEDLPDHYAAADAFVFPTRYEAHSLVILEALASGLPVVLGDIPATREVVTDGREGRLVETGAIPELADAIETVVGPDHEEMAANARERAEDFPWDRTAKETKAVYEEVLG